MLRLAIVLGGIYGIVLITAYILQARLIYFPDTRRIGPAAVGLAGVREEILTVADGTRLVTWRAAPSAPDKPTIVYFHGNGGSLVNRADYFRKILAQGWGLAALSYRGYGGSGGRPSERAVVADALFFYDALRAEGLGAGNLVFFGESLGTGVAVQLCARRNPRALVLHAPYSAVVDIAAERFPFLLPGHLLRDRYPSRDHIAAVKAPVLWVHGDADFVVPIRFGRALYAAAPEPKTAAVIPGAGHNDLYSAEIFMGTVVPFVNRAMAPPAMQDASLEQEHGWLGD